MKEKTHRTTTLATDIKTVFQTKYGDKIDMLRMCSNTTAPLLLKDKKSVLNISQDDFVGIFDMRGHHFFIPPEQVYRFGTYCELATHKKVAMILKSIWESYLAEMAGFPNDPDLKLDSILSDQELITSCISDFKPKSGTLFKLFKEDPIETGDIITYDTFEFIVQDLVEGKHFLHENEGLDQLYPVKDISEAKFLSKTTPTQREYYLKEKELWLLKSTDLDDMLLLLERKKRVNLAIENKYFETFGKQETERADVRYQLEKYSLVLKIMDEQPDLNIREAMRLAKKEMLAAEQERSQIRNKIARSQNKMEYIIPQESRSVVTAEFTESYMEACKDLLHKLFFMLHTDTCPGYEDLSPEQQLEINDLWLQVMKSSNEELFSFSQNMILYSMPDFDQLETIYRKACQILEIDPEDFTIGNRLEFMIRKGSSIESIIEFLSSEKKALSLHLANLEMIQNEYTNEDLTQSYRHALSDISEHKIRLDQIIFNMNEQIKELKKKISATNQKIEM